MSGLPRDILKWIQSLDLSSSVKNVKRDFANGFLVAEIFSHYYPNNFTMHSYTHGSSTTCKENNWEQIQKNWDRLKIEFLTPQEIHDIISFKQDSAHNFICKIYESLTNKKLRQAKPGAKKLLPSYAKATASHLVGQALRSIEDTNDLNNTRSIARHVIKKQNKSLKQEKIDNPERFRDRRFSQSLTQNQNENKENKRAAATMESQQKVTNPEHLRSQQISSIPSVEESNLNQTMEFPIHEAEMSSVTNANPHLRHAMRCSPTLPIDTQVEQQFYKYNSDSKLTFEQIMVQDGDIIGICFEEIPEEMIQSLGLACIDSPKQFYRFTSMCFTILQNEASEKTYNNITRLFCEVGRFLMIHSTHYCVQSFQDFCLTRWVNILLYQSSKMIYLADIFAAFNMNSINYDHINSLMRLKERIPQTEILVPPFLSMLVQYENDDMTTHVYQVYRYNCICSIHHLSHIVRLSGLVILKHIQNSMHDPDLIWSCLDQIHNLIDDEFEEIQSQCVIILTNLLQSLSGGDERISKVYQIIESLLQVKRPAGVERIALWHLGTILKHHPLLTNSFIYKLFSLKDSDRQILLNAGQMEIQSEIFSSYSLTCPNSNWHALSLWNGVSHIVTSEILENLQREHVQLIFVSMNVMEEFPEDEIYDWAQVFESLKNHILVELCDEWHCEGTVQLILKFCHDDTLVGHLKQLLFCGDAPSFLGILKLINPNGNEQCKLHVENLLKELSQVETLSNCVEGMLNCFKEKEPIKFNQANYDPSSIANNTEQ